MSVFYEFPTESEVMVHPRKTASRLAKLFATSVLCFGLLLHADATRAAGNCETSWPAWDVFKKNFISEGGRVIDAGTPRMQSTSEGQAYALFFALIANDRKNFDLLLNWTEANLAEGDLTARLPAWLWGKRDDGSWGIIDKNPASDADLWLAYTLGEAANLWADQRYAALSTLIAKRILREETATLPKLGLTLLPAPSGFTPSATSWKLNPSYMPIQVLRWFANNTDDDRWEKLIASSLHIIKHSASKGYSPDWIIFDASNDRADFVPDLQGAEKGDGGYNAIRVYLWAGMLSEQERHRKELLNAFKPMANLIENKGYPPEFINIRTGEFNHPASSGFSAAVLPFLKSSGAHKAYKEQNLRIQAQPIKIDAYYDQVLALYAQGWQDQLYQFNGKGNVLPKWKKACRQ
ncbi:cellulase [Undibacterium sp. Jales W-56]|uniref:cellulose synthase complex periplasmic endoglucanase BcsZ n=1 Tax=Undibacterium sp. Jales W-56 TaxID=2897325 RepID=UPI0021D018EF|nr:cellulose synthase complex periplasmic endoglucanase BcsZ [Undibacterium sp. Jales W-56]MCU6435853.1 cellulase [Undibacterium sp. Jales W-56]